MKKIMMLLLAPVLLFAWGNDLFVAHSDTTDGNFITYDAVVDKYNQDVVFAVHDLSPYYLYVYAFDTLSGSFTYRNHINLNSRPDWIKAHYNYADSTTYVFLHFPDYAYSNFTVIPFHYDFSWTFGEIKNVDATPDDTLILPHLTMGYDPAAMQDIYYITCIKRNTDRDSVIVYATKDPNGTWTRNRLAYTTSPDIYKELNYSPASYNDTSYLYRAYVLEDTSSSTYYVTPILYRYHNDSLSLVGYGSSIISDSVLYNLYMASFDSAAVMVYQKNGNIYSVKLDSLLASQDTPVQIINDGTYKVVRGFNSFYTFGSPSGHTDYGILYDGGLPIMPNTVPIFYLESSDGQNFSTPENVSDSTGNWGNLSKIPLFLYEDAIVTYPWYTYHGTFPYYAIDAVDIYLDRKSAVGIKENAHSHHLHAGNITGANIAGNALLLTINSVSQANINLNLYDASGRLVRNLYKGKMQKGTLRIDTNISGLKRGIYFVAEKNGNLKTFKFVKP